MNFQVQELDSNYNFEITGVSYIGRPTGHTAMYITKKAEHLLVNLCDVSCCLIFAEETIDVPEELKRENCFIQTSAPQTSYVAFLNKVSAQDDAENQTRPYKLMPEGYWLGENVTIGVGAVIEPGCLIGHDVTIGDNARILCGASIKNATIGDNFIAGEHCAVGAYGFTMAEDEAHNKIRIPTLGKVKIGNHVEIGAVTNVSAGSAGDTVISDYVKIDVLVHIGHDAALHKNVEIPAGAIIGGFAELCEGVFVGVNAAIRNRVSIGIGSIVGMGAVVTRSVEAHTTVVGNPAKKLEKRE